MAKLKFNYPVHLSEAFGGKKHGEPVRDSARGAVEEIKNDKLAAHLVEQGLAVVVESAEPKK